MAEHQPSAEHQPGAEHHPEAKHCPEAEHFPMLWRRTPSHIPVYLLLRLEFCIRRIYRFPLKLWLLPVPPLSASAEIKQLPQPPHPGGMLTLPVAHLPAPLALQVWSTFPSSFPHTWLGPYPSTLFPHPPVPDRSGASPGGGAGKGDATFLMKTNWH